MNIFSSRRWTVCYANVFIPVRWAITFKQKLVGISKKMVHPSHLLRTTSDGERFTAPLGNYLNEIDCGIKLLPCLNKQLKLEKLARIGVFVGVLCVVGFLQGALLGYFRSTSQLWGQHYNLSKNLLDWLIFANEIFAGLFAIIIAYWGNRIHRISWIGGLTIFLSTSCIILIIPEVYRPYSTSEIKNVIADTPLCNSNVTSRTDKKSADEDFDVISIALVAIFQLLHSMASVSLLSHGISYIDDHITSIQSPGYISLLISIAEIGKQVGIYCSWIPYISSVSGIFASPAWILLVVLLFVAGCLISLFPKELPQLVMMKSVNSLITIASGQAVQVDEPPTDGFFRSILRILRNNILLINIFSFALIESALINFSLLEKHFNQSKYHLPIPRDSSGYSDPNLIQITINLLRQPMVAAAVLISGLIIAKFKPSIRPLIAWNVIVFILVALIFGSTVFWNCADKIRNEHDNIITIPVCSGDCGCSSTEQFQPVCVDGTTYFSPCLAGCREFSSATNVYQNCSCGNIVTRGSCSQDKCSFILAISQANNIIIHALLATTVVTNLIINIRCVDEKDKSLAIGMEMTLLGLVPYLPIKYAYNIIADTFCEIKETHNCYFYSNYFTIFLSMMTIGLMTAAAVVAMGLIFVVHDIPLYDDDNVSHTSALELRSMRRLNEETNNDSSNGNGAGNNVGNINETNYENNNNNGGKDAKAEEAPFLKEPDRPAPRPPLSSIKRRSRRRKEEKNTGQPSTSQEVRLSKVSSTKSDDSLDELADGLGDDHDSVISLNSRNKSTEDEVMNLVENEGNDKNIENLTPQFLSVLTPVSLQESEL